MKQSAYALQLAGAAALAGSTQAYGQIVPITPPANLLTPGTSENYFVPTGTTNGTGLADDFTFSYAPGGGSYLFTTAYGLKPASGIAATYVSPNGSVYAAAVAIAPGTKIGSDTFTFAHQPPTAAAYPNTYLATTFAGAPVTYSLPVNTDTYIGFQFADGTNTVHNGWLELNYQTQAGDLGPAGLYFIAGAYNLQADGSPDGDILAGEIPEPGTLSSLVLGAAALAGVGLMRRRRTANA